MKATEDNTEDKILMAAEQIFLRDGYSGSRMQDIADLAGINKALLHYYFRNKDKLFEQIFEKKSALLFPQMKELLEQAFSFEELIYMFIEKYIHLLLDNPFLPLFVITTINKPDNENFIKKLPTDIIKKLIMVLQKDVQEGKVKPVNPLHFMLSVLSMCAFPFMAKPMITEVTKANDEQFKMLMESRIVEIQNYVKVLLHH